jgi:methylmalonyl-CoA mutase
MTELAGKFPVFSEADWRKLAGEMAVSRSADGLPVGPIYSADGGETIAGRAPGMRWRVVSRIASSAGLREAIESDLAGGVDGIDFTFAASPMAMGEGIAAPDDLLTALKGIDVSRLYLRVDAGEESPAIARLLRPMAVGGLAIAFDPIATLAARGRLRRSYEEIGSEIGRLAKDPADQVVITDGRLWHAGGASEAEELAAVLAAFAEYLRLIESAPTTIAPSRIGIVLAADADQFLTIAKFRAMRLLHARLLEAAGVEPRPCHIHGETAWRMLSGLDPHTNILRITAAVFSAAVGGADSVTALPYDTTLGSHDAFARRIARNSQTILIEEAGIARVADAGAGSGAVEALTRGLAETAWNRFRAIEKEGGLLAAVLSGSVQRSIAAMRDKRLSEVARNEIQIVGANVFRDRSANPPAPRPVAPGIASGATAVTAEALQFIRLSEASETAHA